MSFPTDRIHLGPHAYGVRPKTYGVVLHTTEYPSSSLAHGLQCVRDQSPGGSLYSGGGSYNFILTDEGPILAVPYLEAAGGISGDHTPPSQISPRTGRAGSWEPDPWLLQMLPVEAYNDPNLYLLQLSVSGKTAELQNYPAIDAIATDAARILAWAEEQPEIEDNLVVMGHMSWQTDRLDPGQWFIDRVLEEYTALTAPPVEVPPTGPTPLPTTRFSDVTPAHWAYAAIEWAALNGIASGLPDGRFGPDEPATRAQIVTFLHRYSQKVGP